MVGIPRYYRDILESVTGLKVFAHQKIITIHPGHKAPDSAYGMRLEYAAGVVVANGGGPGRGEELCVGRFCLHMVFLGSSLSRLRFPSWARSS